MLLNLHLYNRMLSIFHLEISAVASAAAHTVRALPRGTQALGSTKTV